MKLLPLVVANLLRKKIRTVLTISSFAGALFLFGILIIVRDAFTNPGGMEGSSRIVVFSRVSPIPIQPLPIAYRDRIARIDGVAAVTSLYVSPAFYQNDRMFIVQAAIDIETHRAMYPEFRVSDEEWHAFVTDREGCVIGEGLAARYGWKPGDRVPIRSAMNGFRALEFNIRGIYRPVRPGLDDRGFWYSRKLIEDRNDKFRGVAGWYVVRAKDPAQATGIATAIDREFANSPRETRSTTENQFGATMANQMGNIKVLILSIGMVVLVTLLMVTGNTMSIAVRERIGELAVLKAVGFSDVGVLLLVLLESLVIAGVGGTVGLVLAKLYSLRGDPTGGLLVSFHFSWVAMGAGFVVALAVGIGGGLIPAVSAMRLRVVQAMRRV